MQIRQITGIRLGRGSAVELSLQIRRDFLVSRSIRPRHRHGRHGPRPKLLDGPFPGFSVGGGLPKRGRVENHPASFQFGAMAPDAILAYCGLSRLPGIRLWGPNLSSGFANHQEQSGHGGSGTQQSDPFAISEHPQVRSSASMMRCMQECKGTCRAVGYRTSSRVIAKHSSVNVIYLMTR